MSDTSSKVEIKKINEINDKSVELILEEKIEEALKLLKGAEKYLDKNNSDYDINKIEKKTIILILHNIACCFQKLKIFESCVTYLETVIFHYDGTLDKKYKIKNTVQYFLKANNKEIIDNPALGDIILQMRYSAKFHLQMCAVLSQSNKHTEALEHARISALICEDNIIKTYYLFDQLKKKIIVFNKDEISCYDDKIKEIQNIVDHLYNKITKETKTNPLFYQNIRDNDIYKDGDLKEDLDLFDKNEELKNSLTNILGNKKSDDWINYLNIGNIMYLSALNYEDLDIESDPKFELLRDAVLEKIVMLTVAYFCIATEIRFFETSKNNSTIIPTITSLQSIDKSELWHSKAVEFSCLYLPSICPLVKHYISSYHKHYTSILSIIPEEEILNNQIEIQRANVEFEKDPVFFIKSKNISMKAISKPGSNSIKKEEKKVFKINLAKCLVKENPITFSNAVNASNAANDDILISPQFRDLKFSKSSSTKSLIKKSALTDRTSNQQEQKDLKDFKDFKDFKETKNVIIKFSNTNNFSDTNNSNNKFNILKFKTNLSSTNVTNSKLIKLTKIYTNGITNSPSSNNFNDLKKRISITGNTTTVINTSSSINNNNNNNNNNQASFVNANNQVNSFNTSTLPNTLKSSLFPKKETAYPNSNPSKTSENSPMHKLNMKYKISPLNATRNNFNSSNTFINGNTNLTQSNTNYIPLNTMSSLTLNLNTEPPLSTKYTSRNTLTSPTSRNSSKNNKPIERGISSPKLEKKLQELPKIKKLKEFAGMTGSNFTLSLITGNHKFKELTNFFNTSNKKIYSPFNKILQPCKDSKDAKDDNSQATQNSTLNSTKPKLLKNTIDSPTLFDLEKDLFISSAGSRNKSKDNKFKIIK